MQPSFGLLTWHAEGVSDPRSPYYSRRTHWPGGSSGVTLGRGYDMRERTRTTVRSELMAAGVSEKDAILLSVGAGMVGMAAEGFAANLRSRFELTAQQEVNLFEAAYSALHDDVIRIFKKPDVVASYGEVDVARLSPKIMETVVDLRFRGDWTSVCRRFLHPPTVANDLARFAALISDRSRWPGVPRDRFERRMVFVN